METFFLQENKENKEKFKSYYVVWKLHFFAKELKNMHEFKSYYVVWKRIRKMTADFYERV